MKKINVLVMMILTVMIAQEINAQKKTQEFTVSREMNVSADKVWQIVGEGFADIAKSHPMLASSDYINGHESAGEGCERVCAINESGSKYTHEKQVNYDPANYTFDVEMSEVAGMPLDAEYSGTTYKVEAIDADHSRFIFTME